MHNLFDTQKSPSNDGLFFLYLPPVSLAIARRRDACVHTRPYTGAAGPCGPPCPLETWSLPAPMVPELIREETFPGPAAVADATAPSGSGSSRAVDLEQPPSWALAPYLGSSRQRLLKPLLSTRGPYKASFYLVLGVSSVRPGLCPAGGYSVVPVAGLRSPAR